MFFNFKVIAILMAVYAGILPTSAFAGTYELRGTLPLVANSCPNAPSSMIINQRLKCVGGYCGVNDRTNGIVMDGLYPINFALLDATFDLGNSCKMIVAYTYSKINSKAKTARLKEVFITLCNWGSCSSRYEGTAKIR